MAGIKLAFLADEGLLEELLPSSCWPAARFHHTSRRDPLTGQMHEVRGWGAEREEPEDPEKDDPVADIEALGEGRFANVAGWHAAFAEVLKRPAFRHLPRPDTADFEVVRVAWDEHATVARLPDAYTVDVLVELTRALPPKKNRRRGLTSPHAVFSALLTLRRAQRPDEALYVYLEH